MKPKFLVIVYVDNEPDFEMGPFDSLEYVKENIHYKILELETAFKEGRDYLDIEKTQKIQFKVFKLQFLKTIDFHDNKGVE